MATTSKMGIPYPASTDFVKDGATDMQAIADQVDLRSGLVKIIPSGATNGTVAANGDVTIGSAVLTVTVTDAFSADYDNYLIQIAGGASSAVAYLEMQLGATTSGYRWMIMNGASYSTASGNVTFLASTTGTHFRYVGYCSANGINANIHVMAPHLANRTVIRADVFTHADNAGSGNTTGLLANNTQYTSFIIDPEGPVTMTGGTIRIYGYN